MRSLLPAVPLLAALVVGVAAAPISQASADSYNDATTGLYVATPDDFAISRGVREGYDLVLHINPTGSYPNRVEGESRLCGLYFKAVPSAEVLPLSAISKRLMQLAAMPAQKRRTVAR